MSSLADDTRWMDAIDQAALVDAGEVAPVELLDAAIERIERIDPRRARRSTRRWSPATGRPGW